jgi:GNAT superfamily N-acetyltransferase
MIDISRYTPNLQPEIKTFVLNILSEFGFNFDQKLDFDLDDPQKYYPDTGGVFYVACDNNKIVGTIAIKIKNGIPVLKRFYVDKKCRGKGIGSSLFDKAILFCKDKKYKKITLDTNNKFCNAFEMYKKKGFKTVNTNNKPACSSCTCHIYMEKEL